MDQSPAQVAIFAEYHIPAHADLADIEVSCVDEQDDKVSPPGVKGLGGIGIVATAAAVANAIFHATGRRIRREVGVWHCARDRGA